MKRTSMLNLVARAVATGLFLTVFSVCAAGQAASQKQAAAGPPQVGGTGRTNFIPIWTNSTTLGDSQLIQKAGDVGLGTMTPGAKLDVVTANTAGTPAILGNSTATNSSVIGVEGTVNSTAVFPNIVVGVFGQSNGTSGDTAGVVGNDYNPSSAGTWGQSFAASGGRGVEGVAYSGSGEGVEGDASDNGSGNYVYGVLGNSTGPNGTGVFAQSFGSSGGRGVEALAYASGGVGIHADVTSAGSTAGVFDNNVAGDIIIGQVSGVHVFRLDGTGKGYFDGGTQTGGADFAESIAVRGDRSRYQPGDLLAIDSGGQRRLALAQQPYSTEVAGIYSTKPGVLATTHTMDNASLAAEVPLAVVGIVPCKVTAQNGRIAVGDLLVASSRPGYAMKGTDRNRMLGAVVGKALEPLHTASGVIQVLVTLQ